MNGRMHYFAVVLILIGAMQAAADEPVRAWQSAGGSTVEAAFVRQTGATVVLRKPDGSQLSIGRDRLSAEDQAYLDALRPAAAPTAAARRAGGDWPGWRGARRDGISDDTGLLKSWPQEGPRQIWHAANIGEGYSSASIADGSVFISGAVNGTLMLFAFDMDGKPRWATDVGPAWPKSYPGVRSTPVIDDGAVYIISGTGAIGCFDAKSGKKNWDKSMSSLGGSPGGWGFAESVLIKDDLAIVTPGKKNCIVALDKKSGSKRWDSPGNGGSAHYGSAIAITHDGADMIVAGTGAGLVGVAAGNGHVLWENDFCAGNTANCTTPAYSDGYVFWANGYGKGGICLKLEGDKAAEVWRTGDMVSHVGGYLIHDGYVYGNNGGGWACVELKSGKTMWKDRGVGKGSLCYADGMLYLFSEDGGRAGLAPAVPTGLEMKGQFSVKGSGKSWAYPVVAGGRLYLRYADNLYCFDVKE